MKKILKADYAKKFQARTRMLEKKAGIKESRLNKNKHHDVFVSSGSSGGGAFLVTRKKTE